MEITTCTVGKCIVLDCSGKLTLGSATATFREAIREAVRDGTSKVILNLDKVTHMDSSGLGEIVWGYTHVTNRGGKLVLLNMSKKIQTMISLEKLMFVFDMFDDEQKALEGCE